MKLHLDSSNGYRIHHYDQHSVTINNVVYTQSLIVMPEYLSEWGVENFNTLQVDDFKRLVALSPELILLGTGLQLRFPVTSLLVPLINQSIGLEVMGLHAACRTYNILMGEGRKVAAALLFK